MKKTILGLSLAIAMAGVALGQTTSTRSRTVTSNETSASKSASKQGRQVNLQSGTQLAAQLENSLDARHAKPGDRVVLKTVSAVKQNGETVVPKGARLIGHVTDVQQQTKVAGESHISILFDSLRTGSTETPITATIVSITQAQTQARANNDLFESDTMSSSSARSSSSGTSGQRGSGGGLLGGVGNTVGGVANTTTSTAGNVAGTTTGAVGSTVGATTNTVGSTTGNLTGSLRGLQITQSSNASAEGGSTLSLSGRNLHLDSGTTFNLAVSNSTSVGNRP
jgi:hypothetical protein